MAGKTALLVGATGLVGGHVLRLLLAAPAYERIITLGRRALEAQHEKLVHRVVDFDQLDLSTLAQIDDVFCCLGTTIRQAGSKTAFRKVDFDYPLSVAEHARRQGAKHYLLVSALGADPTSSIFYNRVKGEVEAAVGGVGYPCFSVFQPSLLTGERAKKRMGEQISEVVLSLFHVALVGPLRKYRAISAEVVARAMVKVAQQDCVDQQIFASDQIAEVGRLKG